MRRTIFCSGVLFFSILALYILTLHPFFPIGDSGEFIVVAKTFGVSHPPGAPLYTILSYIAAWLPGATLVTRLNFLSAIFGGLTVATVFILLYRITKNLLASIAGALALAFSHVFWMFSNITEVYTLALFLILINIAFFAEWLRSKKEIFLYLISFFGGLSLMVHYTSFAPLFFMTIFVFSFLKKNIFQQKLLIRVSLLFFLGLTPLFIIPIAASHHGFINWGNISTLSEFISFITRSDFQVVGSGEQQSHSITNIFINQLPYYLSVLVSSFTLIGILFTLATFIRKNNKRFTFFLFFCFLFLGPLFVLYANFPPDSPYPDVAINHKRLMEQVYIFSFPFLAIGIGLGIDTVFQKFAFLKSGIYKWMSVILVLAFLAYGFTTNYSIIVSSGNTIFRDYGENILKTVYKPTILITGTEEANILNYLYAIEGKNKNNIRLITFSELQTEWYVRDLKKRYPDVEFPFNSLSIGEKLDKFYEKNLQKFSIVFAPIDDQAIQSVSDKFILVPYGLAVELLPNTTIITKENFQIKNLQLFNNIIGKENILKKKYVDLATNEVLMAYARAYTNVGSRSNKLGNYKEALFYLEKAKEIQPAYYYSYLTAASVYEGKKDYDNMLRQYQELLKINPKYLTALWDVAIIYSMGNDQNQAIVYAKRYADAAKTDEEKLKSQQLLQLVTR